jgi:hypothetical protein
MDLAFAAIMAYLIVEYTRLAEMFPVPDPCNREGHRAQYVGADCRPRAQGSGSSAPGR